jgi:hypothetical protein
MQRHLAVERRPVGAACAVGDGVQRAGRGAECVGAGDANASQAEIKTDDDAGGLGRWRHGPAA